MAKGKTFVHLIQGWAETSPSKAAIFGKESGTWTSQNWKQYWQGVRNVGKGLIALGVEPSDCVGIVANNRPEWVISEFGMMAVGAIPAPIYTTNTTAQVGFILGHSQCKIAFCDDQFQLDKYIACLEDEDNKVEKIITMDDTLSDRDDVMTLGALLELGEAGDDEALDARIDALDPADTGLLIYTSGTTGKPKAVQLTHEGMVFMGKSLTKLVDGLDQSKYRALSYLPLCHVAEQLFTNFMHLTTGGQVYFCPDLTLLKEYLPQVKPTVFLGVPRVWEKFEAALGARFADATGVKAKLLAWSRKTELAAFRKEVATGRPVDTFFRRLAHKLVITKLKTALGLEELIIAVTGAAPISKRTQEFFASLGIAIVEGYGMSETSGVATANDPQRPVFGSVGKPVEGVQVRIADDGEIQLFGINMTKGYLRQPEATAELFSEDGWLCTGDLGSIDGDGILRITGRKKDLIITAGGKNVAPAEIEGHLKSIPGVGQAVVVGDRQKYLAALLVLDSESLGELCSTVGISTGSIAEVAKNERVRAYFQKRIETDCNSKLARYQTIKKFEIMPVEFSVDSGELTPTMKIKRNIVNDKYDETIQGLYA